MTEKDREFAAVPPVVGGGAVTSRPGEIASPEAPAMLQLTPDEQQLYQHICETLRQAGIEHLTAGISIAVIVRTFADWLAAAKECEDKGRFQISKTGWATETPWAKDEQRLKMELGQWLPKACLTIPSLARVRKDVGEQGKQDDLFADFAGHVISSPSAKSTH